MLLTSLTHPILEDPKSKVGKWGVGRKNWAVGEKWGDGKLKISKIRQSVVTSDNTVH